MKRSLLAVRGIALLGLFGTAHSLATAQVTEDVIWFGEAKQNRNDLTFFGGVTFSSYFFNSSSFSWTFPFSNIAGMSGIASLNAVGKKLRFESSVNGAASTTIAWPGLIGLPIWIHGVGSNVSFSVYVKPKPGRVRVYVRQSAQTSASGSFSLRVKGSATSGITGVGASFNDLVTNTAQGSRGRSWSSGWVPAELTFESANVPAGYRRLRLVSGGQEAWAAATGTNAESYKDNPTYDIAYDVAASIKTTFEVSFKKPRSRKPGDDSPDNDDPDDTPVDDCDTGGGSSLTSNGATGNVHLQIYDPCRTRGYPLLNTIHANTQSVGSNGPLGSLTFSYNIHVTKGPSDTGAPGDQERWFLVDGDGSRFDCGAANSSPVQARTMYSVLSRTAGGGFELSHAGPPEDVQSAGNFRYLFDANGKLTFLFDAAGNVQALSYDDKGLLSQVLDQSTGRTIRTLRRGTRIISFVENGDAIRTDLEYDAAGRVRGIASFGASARVLRIDLTYDSFGRLASITKDGDKENKATISYSPNWSSEESVPVYMANVKKGEYASNYVWDDLGNFTRRNGKGGVTSYTVDEAGKVVKVTEPQRPGIAYPHNTFYYYDAKSRLVKVRRESDFGSYKTFGYDALGNLVDVGNENGTYLNLAYLGTNLLSVSYQSQPLVTLEYLALANVPSTLTSLTGDRVELSYNAYGQLLTATRPDDSSSLSVEYGEDAAGSNFGLQSVIEDGEGGTTLFPRYSSVGDPVEVVRFSDRGRSGNPLRSHYAYDGLHRLVAARHPDGRTRTWNYQGSRLLSSLDEAGTMTRYATCKTCGKLVGLSGPLGWSLGWTYDSDKDLRAFTDARGMRTVYDYNAAGDLTRTNYPDGTFLSYKVDGLGRRVSSTSGAGENTFEYDTYLGDDRLQRAVSLSYRGHATAQVGKSERAEYHTETGQVSSNSSFTFGEDGTTNIVNSYFGYDYDSMLRLTSRFTSLNGRYSNILYEYTPQGRVKSLEWQTQVQGSFITACKWIYSYDRAGRMTSVASSLGDSAAYTYDALGKIKSQTNSNGTSTRYVRNDARGWVTSIQQSTNGLPFAEYGLTYDHGQTTVGNLTSVDELNGDRVDYAYDALYRLVGEARTGSNAYHRNLAYDLAGNLTTVNGKVLATYDAANKLAMVTNGSVTHDSDGNVTRLGLSDGKGYPELAWDGFDNLRVAQSAGTLPIQMFYDTDGLRTRKDVKSRGKFSPMTFYVFAGSTLLGELDADGNVTKVYTWGADGLVSEREGANVRYFHYGPQGETRHITDASGKVTGKLLYNAYGAPVAAEGNVATSVRYGGKYGYYTDLDTGLILCTYRWYCPALGRWLSRDPIGYGGGSNLYAYCRQSPTNYFDSLGSAPVPNSAPLTPDQSRILERAFDRWRKPGANSSGCGPTSRRDTRRPFADDALQPDPVLELLEDIYAPELKWPKYLSRIEKLADWYEYLNNPFVDAAKKQSDADRLTRENQRR